MKYKYVLGADVGGCLVGVGLGVAIHDQFPALIRLLGLALAAVSLKWVSL